MSSRVLGFFCFVFFYPSGRRSGFLACVKSNQQGKAVITNKLLLVNLCQTMWSDQCVARNKDNIITVWQQSSGLCSSQGFCLAPHFSHVHSPDQTLEARQRHNDTPSQARTLLRSEVSLVLPPTRKIYVTLRKKAMCQRSNTGRCQSLINPQASNLFFLICRAFCYQLTTTDTDSRPDVKEKQTCKAVRFFPPTYLLNLTNNTHLYKLHTHPQQLTQCQHQCMWHHKIITGVITVN